MGIIDTKVYTLKCGACRVQEEQRVHQKGSGWGASWQSGSTFQNFDTTWLGSKGTEPEIAEATCRKCGKPAKAESRYGVGEPKR
jgi:hypothetical protein